MKCYNCESIVVHGDEENGPCMNVTHLSRLKDVAICVPGELCYKINAHGHVGGVDLEFVHRMCMPLGEKCVAAKHEISVECNYCNTDFCNSGNSNMINMTFILTLILGLFFCF